MKVLLDSIDSPVFSQEIRDLIRPSGKIKGKNPSKDKATGRMTDSCVEGSSNSCEKEADGLSEYDKKFHSDDLKIVALSTGWFNKNKRCFHNITTRGNERSVVSMVVDECESTMGCDDEHDYQPPCANNIVDASKAVWKACLRLMIELIKCARSYNDVVGLETGKFKL
ncbi:putative ripening-related protein 5 [Durio zibethinus]|uniref:Ripening-related protein 5 n=1 Tax=Durio zibethinus TaxID=66656 RepID=A0A6P6A5C6_DURZI|nr:putative ripening-related protein 5 [Durio zibethinus]